MPPAQTPSPQERDRPARLTKIAQRLQVRGSLHCAPHTHPQKTCYCWIPPSRSRSRRRCSNQGFGDMLTARHGGNSFNCTKGSLCHHAQNLMQSTTSLMTTGSVLIRKMKSSPCGPYFFGTFLMLAVVRNPTTYRHTQHFLQTLCTSNTDRHPADAHARTIFLHSAVSRSS